MGDPARSTAQRYDGKTSGAKIYYASMGIGFRRRGQGGAEARMSGAGINIG